METRIVLSATWIVVMLIYLLGDVLRIYSGDMTKGMASVNFNQAMWLGIAALMLIPILMVFLTLVLPQPIARWATIVVAGFFLLFNLVGVPGYPSWYDKFLLVVSILFNGVTIGHAWLWE